jgi:hypothetical protein
LLFSPHEAGIYEQAHLGDQALAKKMAVQGASRVHAHDLNAVARVHLLQSSPEVNVILACDDAVDVPLFEVLQIILGCGL